MIVDRELARRRFDRDVAMLFKDPASFEAIGIRLIDYEFPQMTAALRWRSRSSEALLLIDASDYDYRPISGRWVDEGGQILLAGHARVPAGAGFHPVGPDGAQTPGFLCFKGWREYHEHPSHTADLWSALRGGSEYLPLALLQNVVSALNRIGVGAA